MINVVTAKSDGEVLSSSGNQHLRLLLICVDAAEYMIKLNILPATVSLRIPVLGLLLWLMTCSDAFLMQKRVAFQVAS